MTKLPISKTYLGDGAYADFDGYSLVLTTENGIEVTNTIVLDPRVYSALVRYVEGLNNERVHQKNCLCDACAGTEGTYAWNMCAGRDK